MQVARHQDPPPTTYMCARLNLCYNSTVAATFISLGAHIRHVVTHIDVRSRSYFRANNETDSSDDINCFFEDESGWDDTDDEVEAANAADGIKMIENDWYH